VNNYSSNVDNLWTNKKQVIHNIFTQNVDNLQKILITKYSMGC